MMLLERLIKLLINYKYKKQHFYAWSWPIDDKTDIHVISEEFLKDKHRYGTRIETYLNNSERGQSK